MERVRALFRRRTLWGWALLSLGFLWSAVDHLGRLQFVVNHAPKMPEVSAWLHAVADSMATAVANSIAAVWSPFVLQTALIVSGLLWLLVSSRPATKAGVQPNAAAPTPKKKPVDPNVVSAAAANRLARFLQEGQALLQSNADFELANDWDRRTVVFIRAAYGEAEAARYLVADDYGPRYAPSHLVELRCLRIAELGRRLQFVKVLPGFDPADWDVATP